MEEKDARDLAMKNLVLTRIESFRAKGCTRVQLKHSIESFLADETLRKLGFEASFIDSPQFEYVLESLKAESKVDEFEKETKINILIDPLYKK